MREDTGSERRRAQHVSNDESPLKRVFETRNPDFEVMQRMAETQNQVVAERDMQEKSIGN